MTQEEKARAYDKAMKKAKEIKEKIIYSHLSTESCKAVSEYIDTIIPELTESEDERIRKEIVDFIRWAIDRGSITKEQREKSDTWFSYLEKQKEQKPEVKLVFPKFRVGDIIRNVRDKWDKKTRRIFYVDEHGYYFDYRHLSDKVSGGSFGFCFEDDYELVEQKPAEWSEEEKEILDSILSHYVLIDKPIDANGISKEKYISLIKSLRFDTYKKCNSHWKPSEEQMNALNAINCHGDLSYVGQQNQLVSLYQDLKKLM